MLLKPEIHGTSSLSILDDEGNAVSMTLTINGEFGAKIAVPGTGIFLNNEMDDFSSKPGASNLFGLTGSKANAIQPLKRPVSSMTPTIFFKEGEPVLTVGGAGGSRIISSVLQVSLNSLVIFPYDLQRAIFAPRVHHQWLPDQLDLEHGFGDPVRAELTKKGHLVKGWPWASNVFGVEREPSGTLAAVFDPRDEGGAVAQ